MKRFYLAVIALLCIPAYAQVTATITDSDGQTWNNGSWSAILVSPNGTPTINALAVPAAAQGTLSPAGILTATLTPTTALDQSGATWAFTIRPNASAPPSVIRTPITSLTQNLTSILSAGVKAPRFPASLASFGYLDLEVYPTPTTGATYYNVTMQTVRQWNGFLWTGTSGGGGGGGGATLPSSGLVYATSPTTSTAATPAQVLSTFNSSNAATNLVGAGDSRMAGPILPSGEDLLAQLALQPNFTGIASVHNGAVAGDTCALMTSRYTSNVQPYKPSGAITKSILFIQEGINDILAGLSASQTQQCYSAYLNQAVADGFTPVILTSYYSGSGSITPAGDQQRYLLNQWFKTLPYKVIDLDDMFPASTNNPYYGLAGTSVPITGYTIDSSNNATFTASNSFAVGNVVYLDKFPTSTFLNGLTSGANPSGLVVTATTSTSFTVQVVHAAVAANTETGIAEVISPDATHLSPAGIAIAAKSINARFGLGGSATTNSNSQQDVFNPPSGIMRMANSELQVGLVSGKLNIPGAINSNGAGNTGLFELGGDNQCYIFRYSGTTISTACNWAFVNAVTAPQFATSGTTNGVVVLTYTGTAAAAPATNQVQISPNVAITTPWQLSPAPAPYTGFTYRTNTSGIVQESLATSANLATLVQTATGCATAGYFYQGSTGTCVAASGGGTVTNYYTSTTKTGIGPTTFTPTHTLDVYDATASTGSTTQTIVAGAGQSADLLDVLASAGGSKLFAVSQYGAATLAGAITNYAGLSTTSLGFPVTTGDTKSLGTARTSSITTAIPITSTVGFVSNLLQSYTVSCYMNTQVAATGSVALTLTWTDNVSAKSSGTYTMNTASTANYASVGPISIAATASGNTSTPIQYTTVLTGTATYGATCHAQEIN